MPFVCPWINLTQRMLDLNVLECSERVESIIYDSI